MKASIMKGDLTLETFEVPKAVTSAAEELAHLEPREGIGWNPGLGAMS